MGLKELLFGNYQSTVNEVAGSKYRDEYFKRYNPPYTCKGCGKVFLEVTRDCTIDHIIPQHLGGTNSITNLQVLCQSCNSSKKAKISMLSIKYSGDALIREIKRLFEK